MRRAVFLDRDGVLIRTFVRDAIPHPPQSQAEIEILPGVPEALRLLRDCGFLLLIVTNQPDVARRSQTRETVNAMNDRLRSLLPLDGVYTCFHDNADRCSCRKPAPGMLLQAAADHNIDMANSFMVGDRGSDIAAGAAAGCRTFLIERPYSRGEAVKPTFKTADLMEVANCISAECRVRNAE